MYNSDYDTLPERIQSIYDTCSDKEKKYLIQILEELSQTGTSPTYDTLWLEDYVEIPVSLDTFLSDTKYLGAATDNANSIYPYWKESMHEIFDNGTLYTQVVFTGATRIGKTSTAITCAAYMLYKMMCLRDPQKFFQKKEVSQFSLLFFNLTLDLAKSVAFREFNDTLRTSFWFNQHGTFSKSERNFYYIPEGGKIVVEAGSDVSHSLGKQVFCLVGDTKVLTPYGKYTLQELYNTNLPHKIYSVNSDREPCVRRYSRVKLTKLTNYTMRLHINNHDYVEGTPDHKLLMNSGEYKELREIVPGDKLAYGCHSDMYAIVSDTSTEYYYSPIPVYDVIDVEDTHNFIICCGDEFLVSHNCAVLDEVNFAKSGVKDINKAKARIKEIYDSVVARVEGTFRQQGEVYGKIFAVSSKKSDSDFMEDHVQKQQAAGNIHLIAFDKPQWEVLPPDQFNPERFYIAIGDRHRKGFVVKDDSEPALQELREQGYTLLQVPLDMKSNFLSDFDISLRDLAGIAVPGALSFITQDVIDVCIGVRHNPFYQEILEIGTRDTYTIEEFFHMETIPKSFLSCPWFIDVDLSLNTDKTGISGVALTGRKDIVSDDNKTIYVPTFSHMFSIDIQAPRGSKIAYAKITSFLLWLRRQHINIERISRDQFQSEYMAQLLEAEGFTVDKLSVDRTPDGYEAFRSLLLDHRIDLLDIQLLQDELIKLQRDALSLIPDHPVGGSKDLADSLARACWNAILHNEGIPVNRTSVSKAIASVNIPTNRSIVSNADKLSQLFPNLYNNKPRRR